MTVLAPGETQCQLFTLLHWDYAFNFPSWGHAQSELPLCMILQQLRGIPDLPGVRCCSHQEVVLLLSTSAQGTCMRV